jgi:hypothetical protein
VCVCGRLVDTLQLSPEFQEISCCQADSSKIVLRFQMTEN